MQANGACINLTQEGALRLGRQHVAPSFGGAAHVSRQLTQPPAAHVKIALPISLTQMLQCKSYLCHLRVQCEVSSVSSGRQACLLLTSRSKHNPTGIQLGTHRSDHKQVVKLLNEGKWQQLACGITDSWGSSLLLMTAGESTQLHVGDRILMLANQLDQFLEVAKSAEASSAETAQPPPQKRCSSFGCH